MIDRSLLNNNRHRVDTTFRFAKGEYAATAPAITTDPALLNPAVPLDPKAFVPVMGVELEITTSENAERDNVRHVHTLFKGFVGCKSDGSLPNEGYEIVSSPATLRYHKEEGLWKEFFKYMDGKWYRNSRAGMHVHINKRAFTPYTMGLFVGFLCNPANQKFIELIAERPSNSYCRIPGGNASKLSWIADYRNTDKNGHNNDRYQAANSQNTNTIEVRIFHTTLEIDSFFKNIEFVYNLWEFVTYNTSVSKCTPEEFVKFIENNPSYHNQYLRKFLIRKKLATNELSIRQAKSMKKYTAMEGRRKKAEAVAMARTTATTTGDITGTVSVQYVTTTTVPTEFPF